MNKYVESFQEFFGPLSNAQRAMFVVLMLVVLTIIGGVFYWSQQEENVLLFGSLQPEVAQEIVTELNNRGINYELQESGRAIYVASDKVHELRLELAPMGGSFSDVKGYELFDTNALGMTDFMQQVNKKRALEGELARSINSLEQVEFSRIHLVLPERSPFEDVSVEASASVILNLKKGQALKKEQIEGITSLIAGSVEGLESANVTVLDQAGNRLTDEIDYESELAFGSSQMQLRQKTEAYLTERGQSMLDRVLGAGNSILRVSVEHDFDRVVRESDLIDPDSRTVISEEKREQTNNDEVMEPVAGNVTNNNQTGSVVVASNNNGSTVQTRNYEVNRTREVFEKTQGELKMVSASVLLNYKQRFEEGEEGEQTLVSEPYSEQEVEEFKEVVKVALGIQDSRGDQLTVKQVEFFDKHPIDSGDFFTGQPTFTNNILRWSLIGITFVVVILLINSLKKKSGIDELRTMSNFEAGDQLEGGEKQGSLPGESSAANQLEGAEGNPGTEGEEQAKQLPEKKYNKDEIVNFVELKPAEAAQVMRAMIASEEN
ncbi:MAG: flagellar M-ring protein FliF [Gracilimonas sp.]|uniref:flagellar basal-body MS-ring/collar protein FliF n=1 Tax=Gracilimonas TaxID=649462 RepID=UPI001B06762C|nr:flagellar basal-body MS-ring/collar protein FliF [Gracilimonas sp.]MBO6586858.1 flagellar M-ring protein FliF [Gracilimonas sp.]MBO6614654.1 flagellar M-ring protein FliF [Gracilimonas sp.]